MPQGAAERAAGRLSLRLGGLVVDVVHGRAAGGRQLGERESKRAARPEKAKGNEKGKAAAEARLGPGGTKALPAASAIAPSRRPRLPRAVGEGRRAAGAEGPRGSRAAVASGLGLFSVW